MDVVVDEEAIVVDLAQPPRHRHRLGRGRRLVEQRGVGDVEPGEARSTIVWKLSNASSRPWLISGWYGV